MMTMTMTKQISMQLQRKSLILDELIEVESLLKTLDDVEINWEANACDIIDTLEEKEKPESEKESQYVTDSYSTDALTSNFSTALNHTIYLRLFLINKGFTDVVEGLQKAESNFEEILLSSNKEQRKYQPQIFFYSLYNVFSMYQNFDLLKLYSKFSLVHLILLLIFKPKILGILLNLH